MILLRHGQSEFNRHFTATRRDPGIPDPRLTAEGEAQAAAAAAALAAEGIERIIVSPYTRALQTAAPIAARLGVPVEVNPVVRERFHFSCDIGTPRSVLARAWPAHDFSRIEEIWWPAETETTAALAARAALFRAEITATAAWRHTLVVSHWAFIVAMTGERLANGTWIRTDATRPLPDDPWATR